MSEASGGSTGRGPGRGVGDTNILRNLRQCWRHENRQLERVSSSRSFGLVLVGTVTEIAGSYVVTVEVSDQHGAVATSDVVIEVVREEALVQLSGGNITAIPVSGHGASGSFDLKFKIRHADPDVGYFTTAGNLTFATPDLVLLPVGPGSPVEGV